MRRSLLQPFLVATVLLAGCAYSGPESEPVAGGSGGEPETEHVGEARSEISPERVIPIRFVQLLSAPSCTEASPCAGNESSMAIREATERAVEIFDTAGIKLWIKSEERVNAPNLAAFATVNPSFGSVKNDLKKIYPNMPLDAYEDGEERPNVRSWAAVGATLYGADDEIVVYVWPGGGQSAANFPEEGRMIRMMGQGFLGPIRSSAANPDPEVPGTSFAHELGHYFGLRHTFDGPDGVNPANNEPWTAHDRWQEFKCTTTGDALTGPEDTCASTAPIDGPGQCWVPDEGAGIPRCIIGGQNYLVGDAEVDGIFREIPGVTNDPPNAYSYSANIMGYRDSGYWFMDEGAPGFISETQMAIMDLYLTNAAFLGNVWGYARDDGQWPASTVANSFLNRRDVLGTNTDDFLSFSNGKKHTDARFSFATYAKPVTGTDYKPVSGDFDNDGRMDILWYRPADTTARFWWGRADRGFDEDNRTGFFPETGYTVFTGDFDGDSDSDLFLYKPGAGQDRIKRRTTGRNFTANASDTLLAISGTFLPLVGNFDGSGGDDIYWYSSGSSFVNRWFAAGNNTFTKFDNVPTPAATVPIVGDFDGNGSADVLWYLAGGSNSEALWYGPQTGTNHPVGTTFNVTGTYEPLAGDFDDDGITDILWDAKNSRNDAMWAGKAGGGFDRGGNVGDPGVTHAGTMSFHGAFNPVAGDFDGDGSWDIMWYRE